MFLCVQLWTGILNTRWKDLKQDIREQKQDIENAKQDIREIKQDIEIQDGLNSKTKQHIRDLFLEFGYDIFFWKIGCAKYSWNNSVSGICFIKKNVGVGADLSNERKGERKVHF